MLLPQRKTYKGILQLRGGSIMMPGKNARKFSAIRIGRQELHNIEVSQYFEQLLVPGKEIELTLTSASLASFMFTLIGGILYFAGKMSEFNELAIIGPIVFVVGGFYWFVSFINSGHGIYSIKVNDKLHFDKTGAEASAEAGIEYAVSVSPASNLSEDIRYEVPAPPVAKLPEKGDGLPFSVEKYTDMGEGERPKKSDLSAGFSSSIPGVSKLTCPQCATEALVVPNTNIICGNCAVWMQVDKPGAGFYKLV